MSSRETHIGTVVANQDPEFRGRIKCACVGLLGDEDEALPMWIPPSADLWGWFTVPDIGEQVELEFISKEDDDESPNMASIANNDIRWKGRHWGATESGDAARPIPDDFKQNYGKRRGFATPGGHVLMFDDTDGKHRISLMWSGDKDKGEYAYMAFDETGSWTCANKKGSLIYMNAKDGEMAWIDQWGNCIKSTTTGVAILDKNGNALEMKDGLVQILAQSACTISCKDCTIDAGNIELAPPAVDAMIKGTTFMALFSAHVHPTAFGPSGPPVPTGTESLCLSTKAKVGG